MHSEQREFVGKELKCSEVTSNEGDEDENYPDAQ